MAPNQIFVYYPRKETYTLQSIRYELSEEQPGVAIATFDTPSNLNALTLNLMQEMFLILEHAKRDEDVEVLIWTGAGRAFCAGFVVVFVLNLDPDPLFSQALTLC